MAKAIPKAPAGLSNEAQKWWGKLNADWQLEPHALLLLELALQSLDRIRQAQVAIAEHGILLDDDGKLTRLNPAARAEADNKKLLLSYFRELGFSLEPLNAGPGRPPGR